MSQYKYDIMNSNVKDTSEAIKGKDIFYKCGKCGDLIPSVPKDNINCKCLNIGIDKDMNRLFVEDFGNFSIVKKTKID